jgi:hypothetical protein
MSLDEFAVADWFRDSVSETIAKGIDDQRFDLRRGNARDAAGTGRLFLQ